VPHGFPDQVVVDLFKLEHLGHELDGVDLLVFQVQNGMREDRHVTPPA